jgi:hypothetical protein
MARDLRRLAGRPASLSPIARGLVAIIGMIFAAVLGLSVRAIAHEATDIVLLTARRLAEISSLPEGNRLALDRLGAGIRWSIHRGVASRGGDYHGASGDSAQTGRIRAGRLDRRARRRTRDRCVERPALRTLRLASLPLTGSIIPNARTR